MERVCLFNLEQAGVIIEDPKGLCFFNQVGSMLNGDVNEAPSDASVFEQVGWFVPLSNDAPLGLPSMTELLQALAQGTAVSVSQLNEILIQVSSSDQLQVDSSRYPQAHHGWLPVTIVPQGDFSLLEGFEERKGVLTWPLDVSV